MVTEADPNDQARRATVLLVDDDSAVRRVAAKTLRRAGYSVIEAEGGEQALELGRLHREKIDLLLTDVVMPGMNGRELSEHLKHLSPTLPVLFMSAYAEDEIFLHGVRLARMNFIPKPFTLNELTDSVASVLGRVPNTVARRPDQAAEQ